MVSVLSQFFFQDEEAAYAKLKNIAWPNSATCPDCACTDRTKTMGGTATHLGLYKCYACRKHSRVTVGTIFESSHVRLHVWLQAMLLIERGMKGVFQHCKTERVRRYGAKCDFRYNNRGRLGVDVVARNATALQSTAATWLTYQRLAAA